MSPYLKEAIQQGVLLKRLKLEEAGEKEKGKSWKPDFHLEIFGNGKIPVLIENKLGINKLSATHGDKIKNGYKISSKLCN